MALTSGQFGQLFSVKWRYDSATDEFQVVLFDQVAGSEQEFSAGTLGGAFKAAQAFLDPLMPGVRLCFSGAVVYVED